MHRRTCIVLVHNGSYIPPLPPHTDWQQFDKYGTATALTQTQPSQEKGTTCCTQKNIKVSATPDLMLVCSCSEFITHMDATSAMRIKPVSEWNRRLRATNVATGARPDLMIMILLPSNTGVRIAGLSRAVTLLCMAMRRNNTHIIHARPPASSLCSHACNLGM